MEKQNIEEFVERNAVGTPKFSVFTIKDAIALHPDMIFTTPSQIPEVLELRKIVRKIIPDLKHPVQFYSDVVSYGLFDYRHQHEHSVGFTRLCVALQVFTKDNDELVYTLKLRPFDVWGVKGLEEFGDHIVAPTSLTLMRNVANDVGLEDIQQVTAYVYEEPHGEYLKQGGVSDA